MEINQRIKEELEGRIKKLEDFVANKGLGSGQVKKVKKVQRNINIAVFLGSILTVAGVTFWALNRNHKD